MLKLQQVQKKQEILPSHVHPSFSALFLISLFSRKTGEKSNPFNGHLHILPRICGGPCLGGPLLPPSYLGSTNIFLKRREGRD